MICFPATRQLRALKTTSFGLPSIFEEYPMHPAYEKRNVMNNNKILAGLWALVEEFEFFQ
jgi:hypothetical protein